jgi:hypothetical protein
MVLGLLVSITQGKDSVRAIGALFSLLLLTAAVWQYLVIKNKSITVTGDRIQIVTASGSRLTFDANEISAFRYNDATPATMNSRMHGILVLDQGFFFTFGEPISDFSGLIEELKAIAPPSTIKGPSDS